ncbi:MAG: hypothetical protein Q9M44_03575, partial [Ghiorsea sp.]|nr:hypothetical protein [Ghiorsea sp.]
FIRWIRYPKPGEQQMGLDFYMQKHVVLKAVMLSIGDTSEHRKWPVLVSFEEGNEHTMLFPDGNIFTGLVFSIQRGVQKDLFKVLEILDQGANYSLCVAGEASELDTQNVDSGSK